MEAWRRIWREGICPELRTDHLQLLKTALETDDQRLLQRATTSPPPLQCVQDWNCEGACLLGFAGWQGDELTTVHDVETFFAKLCYECDQRMGESGIIRHLLNWFDDTPRAQMRQEMLAEINLELEKRP